MKDYNGVPERDPNPPDRYVWVAKCPHCGCEELGEVVFVASYRRIVDWCDKEPWLTEEDDREDMDYREPRFYCCGCGENFERPDFIEELGY